MPIVENNFEDNRASAGVRKGGAEWNKKGESFFVSGAAITEQDERNAVVASSKDQGLKNN